MMNKKPTDQEKMMHRCRCCEKTYSLLPFAGYDYGSICPHCGWEEDELDPIGYSCANRSTLEAYRKKLACLAISY